MSPDGIIYGRGVKEVLAGSTPVISNCKENRVNVHLAE